MKKIKTLLASLLMLSTICGLLAACGDSEKDGAATTTEAPDAAPTTTVETDTTITITLKNNTVSGEGSVELAASRTDYKQGNEIVVTLPEGQKFVAFNLAKEYLKEAILYVPNGTFTYTIPNLSYSYPSDMAKASSAKTITARIPTEAELTANHNLALNPADLLDPDMTITGYTYDAYWSGNVYPHVTTSSACRYNSDEASKYQFEARNAIDGFIQNNGHGSYPVQSWGPDSDFNTRNGYITINFGHEVTVNTLGLYIRADFPHDTYFTSMEVQFSDGSKLSFDLTNDADLQEFDLGGVNTSYVMITKLTKDDSAGWAGLMEVQVMGSEIVG